MPDDERPRLRIVRTAEPYVPPVREPDEPPEPERWTRLKAEQPSYTWQPYPGATVIECSDCGPFWLATFEHSDDGRLLLREWHRDECRVWRE